MSLSGYQYPGREITEYLAAIRLRVTPVPIPNTTVKTQAADGTALETVWQSRWPPELLNKCPGSRKAAHLENRIYEKTCSKTSKDVEQRRIGKDIRGVILMVTNRKAAGRDRRTVRRDGREFIKELIMK